ncbi:MAG TPA: ATP-binding protein [Solirubrobacteraceae bacterium]|jgi:DNA replication protein DnaC|nr:ATP-binding protein [Solirubrobacteraceae bacterium]
MPSSRHSPIASAARCPFDACDGSGFQVDEQTNTASDCACRAQRVASARAHRLRERVPRRYMDLSWERNPLALIAQDPGNRDSVRRVRLYCKSITRKLAGGEGLWIMGHTGTGKTTLGYMVAATATHAQHSVLSFNAVALLNRLRASFNPDGRETSEEIIRALTEVELLHIEDLRVVRPTDWVLEQLYLIVNARYEERRAIVFTSDIDSDADGPLVPSPREMSEHIGARTFSRLMEICGDPVVITGKDKRIDLDVPGASVASAESPATAESPWTSSRRSRETATEASEQGTIGSPRTLTLP